MSQGEVVRLTDLGVTAAQVAARMTPAVENLMLSGNSAEQRARLIALMRTHHGATVGACGLDDTLESIREVMRKFADTEVIGSAKKGDITNIYIPLDVSSEIAALGV